MKFKNLILTNLLKNSNFPYICVYPTMRHPPIILFGGTQNLFDLIHDDLSIRSTSWPNDDSFKSDVHGGFARRTLRLAQEMNDFISENDNFIIGGHSLGGACSILLASYLVYNNKNVRSIYTFGAPPLSSKGFQRTYHAQNLWDKTYNFVLSGDPIVKKIPIYQFVGKRIELQFTSDTLWEQHDLNNYAAAIDSYEQ